MGAWGGAANRNAAWHAWPGASTGSGLLRYVPLSQAWIAGGVINIYREIGVIVVGGVTRGCIAPKCITCSARPIKQPVTTVAIKISLCAIIPVAKALAVTLPCKWVEIIPAVAAWRPVEIISGAVPAVAG